MDVRPLILALVVGCARSAGPSPSVAPSRVWIDTDPAVGVPDRDVDDGVALLAALRSPGLDVVAVSTVFGNAPLAEADPIARELVAAWAPGLPVHTGAAGAGEEATPASEALVAALEAGPLDVLVLGPATNVAAALRARPDLAPRLRTAVFVAGRSPGQRFTTGTTNLRAHRDFNFELDPEAARVLLDAGVPLVLAGFPVSRHVWVDRARLDRWEASPDAARLVPAARGWLGLWERVFGVAAFNPFDTLAVGVLAVPELMACPEVRVAIEVAPDDVTEAAMQGDAPASKPYLVARDEAGGRRARHCDGVDAEGFLAWLDARLGAPAR